MKGLVTMKENDLSGLFKRVKENLERIGGFREILVSKAQPPKKCPGTYMLFFDGELQYVGFSRNLRRRIITNLLLGNEKSHTLINKLCLSRKIKADKAIRWLRENSKIKFITTETEDDARILVDVLIALHHPKFNEPLRRLKTEEVTKSSPMVQSKLFQSSG
jgi:excinuclease UvrABC nuclease subunit